MTTIFAGFIGGWELVLILAVVLILFGAKKLPELARGLGQGIKEFKKASTDITSELHRSLEEPVSPPPPPQRPVPQRPEAMANATTEPHKTDSAPKA